MTWNPSRIIVPLLVLAAAAAFLLLTAGANQASAATVAAGERSSCAIFSGTVRCWGGNSQGALGFTTTASTATTATPVGAPIQGATHVAGASTGGNSGHFCAVAKGAAWCWGFNGYGTAGTGATGAALPVPVAVPALGSGVGLIDKNATRTCAVVNGGAQCWGTAYLGDTTKNDSAVPVAVSGLGSGVSDIGAGWRSTCVLSGGAVYCWGTSTHGQLGAQAAEADRPTVPVPLPGAASALDAGTDSACAVVNGGVWCWGSNGNGRLGTGDASAPGGRTPVGVVGLSGIVDVAGDSSHYCALSATGAVYCWGDNQNGKVGNGAVSGDVPSPVQVALPGAASSIAVSSNHSCAAVGANYYCWGSNGYGQLGNGTTGGASGTPVKVLLPPKATATGVAKRVRVPGSRKVTIGTVACPAAGGACTIVAPKKITARVGGTRYTVRLSVPATVAAGKKGVIKATVPAAMATALVGKSVRLSARVTVTNSGGKLVKVVGATVRR